VGFRLGNEIREGREEEEQRLMEKYAEMEAKYQAKKLPKVGRQRRAEEARCQEEEAKRRAGEAQWAREETEAL